MPGGTSVATSNKSVTYSNGHDNINYVNDEGKKPTLELPRLPARTSAGYSDNSHL